jgi:nucleotide-binding universal stress UspA family protein
LLVDVLPYPGPPSFVYRLLAGNERTLPDDFFEPAVAALSGLELETRAYVGASPARVLNDIAEGGEFDLIIVGSPRRYHMGGALGSVGQALLHGAPIPIAAAPQGYAARDHGKLARIAVAYNATEESQAALRHAERLAQGTGAAIEVLTVERPLNPVGGPISHTMDLPEDPKSILTQARHEVDPSLQVDTRVLRGPTAAAALSKACEAGIDLLCVGSRGYGIVARVLLGSVSRQLTHEEPCPLLIVPRP